MAVVAMAEEGMAAVIAGADGMGAEEDIMGAVGMEATEDGTVITIFMAIMGIIITGMATIFMASTVVQDTMTLGIGAGLDIMIPMITPLIRTTTTRILPITTTIFTLPQVTAVTITTLLITMMILIPILTQTMIQIQESISTINFFIPRVTEKLV